MARNLNQEYKTIGLHQKQNANKHSVINENELAHQKYTAVSNVRSTVLFKDNEKFIKVKDELDKKTRKQVKIMKRDIRNIRKMSWEKFKH